MSIKATKGQEVLQHAIAHIDAKWSSTIQSSWEHVYVWQKLYFWNDLKKNKGQETMQSKLSLY